MNRLASTAVISWRTRNWRHARAAERWCKDYNLVPLYKNFYIGTIYRDEREELDRKLGNLFTGRNERYCSFVLCASCVKDVSMNFDSGSTFHRGQSDYELVQIDPGN